MSGAYGRTGRPVNRTVSQCAGVLETAIWRLKTHSESYRRFPFAESGSAIDAQITVQSPFWRIYDSIVHGHAQRVELSYTVSQPVGRNTTVR